MCVLTYYIHYWDKKWCIFTIYIPAVSVVIKSQSNYLGVSSYGGGVEGAISQLYTKAHVASQMKRERWVSV